MDYLEETGDALAAWEFKWNINASARIPLAFSRAYPAARTDIITPSNYEAFLAPTQPT